MSLIHRHRSYDRLVTTGCSFSSGHLLGPKCSWGAVLADKLGCEHVSLGGDGNSNTLILDRLLNYCESHDLSRTCFGIQWTNAARQELWIPSRGFYASFGAGGLSNSSDPKRPLEFDFIGRHLDFFAPIWWDPRHLLIRSLNTMVLAQRYLESRGVDFLLFEGIRSIRELVVEDDPFSHTGEYNSITRQRVESLLADPHYFSRHGDMLSCMESHPLFQSEENGGHPNPAFLDWWVGELWDSLPC